MKTLSKIIFTLAMVVGMALSVSAQKDDQKNRPPKKPPVIQPGEKPPRGNPPPKEEKPKKPGMSFFLVSAKQDSDIA